MDDGAGLFTSDIIGDLLIVRIDDAPTQVHLGVSEQERAAVQEILVSVALTIARAPAAIGRDRIADTVDYDRVISYIRDQMPASPAKLIETLCDRLIAHCFALSAEITEVEIVIKKPSVLRGQGVASVSVRRSR